MNNIELFERQNEIISIQSEIIDDLFKELSQHVTAEELDRDPALEKIKRATELRKDIE